MDCVLHHIDPGNPYFRRAIEWESDAGSRQCELRVWLPVQLRNGGWVAAVHITGIDMPQIAGMPGQDPLDALIRALFYARDAIDLKGGTFLFTEGLRQNGGLPISLNYGQRPEILSEIETSVRKIVERTAGAV